MHEVLRHDVAGGPLRGAASGKDGEGMNVLTRQGPGVHSEPLSKGHMRVVRIDSMAMATAFGKG